MAHPAAAVMIDKGSGNPIVLLHGLGTNHKSWTYVLKELDYTTHRIIALDLLGFGNAPKPKDSTYSLDEHASAVIAALDSLGIEQATIAGHSMGCTVAITIASNFPKRVKRLILLGAPLYTRMPRARLRIWFWRPENAYAVIFKALAQNPDITIAAAKSLKVIAPLVKGMEITAKTWPAFRASLRECIVQTQSYTDAVRIKIPTLLVYGRLDVFVLKRTLQRVRRKNRQYVRYMTMVGPHEITPLHGKKIADLVQGRESSAKQGAKAQLLNLARRVKQLLR